MTAEDQMNVVAMKRIKFPEWEDPPVHPVNNAPQMSGAELKELAEDIKKHGLQEPIVYWRDNREAANGKEGPFPLYLLDGRNRRDALTLLGIDDPRKAKFGNLVATTIRIVDAIKQTNTVGAGGKVTSKWVIKHAKREELPMVITWLRSTKIKTVISAIKSHIGEE